MSEPAPRFTRDEVVEMLARGPERIAAATAGITDADLLAPLEDGGWSARDVLGHMRACQQTWGGYIGRKSSMRTTRRSGQRARDRRSAAPTS